MINHTDSKITQFKWRVIEVMDHAHCLLPFRRPFVITVGLCPFFRVRYFIFNFLSLELFVSRLKFWLKLDEIFAALYRPLTTLRLHCMRENVTILLGILIERSNEMQQYVGIYLLQILLCMFRVSIAPIIRSI